MNSPNDALSRREAIKRASLLLGLAISPSLVTGVMRAAATSQAANGRPVYLTPRQFETASAIAERILPRTDTPGARDVGVPAFIDLMYGEYMTDAEKTKLAEGLTAVEATSRKDTQTSFSALSPAQQDAQLKALADACQALEGTFFHQIKELTIVGYFTSEQVGKNVLHYDPIPGRYDGCIPLSQVGNVMWTR